MEKEPNVLSELSEEQREEINEAVRADKLLVVLVSLTWCLLVLLI